MHNSPLILDVDAHWTAIGTLALAALTFITLAVSIVYNQTIISQAKESSADQLDLLRTQLAAENENAYKYNSVRLILAFDEQFEDLIETRAEAARVIIDNNILERGPLKPKELDDLLDDVYDLFDTIGYFIKNKYIKTDVAHEYFHHWFSRYYAFYEQYKIKESSGYDEAAWNNLSYLSKQLDGVEDHQTGKFSSSPTKSDLLHFFTQEKNS
jgi:hypothetical protein